MLELQQREQQLIRDNATLKMVGQTLVSLCIRCQRKHRHSVSSKCSFDGQKCSDSLALGSQHYANQDNDLAPSKVSASYHASDLLAV